MKKIVAVMLVALLSVNTTNACEICGCGQGNYYIGLLPQFKHHFVGLRYQYMRFHTVMADDASQYSNDYYKTAELWGGWNIGKRWQVLAILPFNFVHQVSDDGVTNRQGIGDIALMVNYNVFNRMPGAGNNSGIAQQLWVGAGIKLPTGKFSIDATDPAVVAQANTQTGTASTDFMLNAMYNLQKGNLGLNTSVSYKINSANRDKYTFGNKLSASTFLSYAMQKGKFNIVPNAGLQYENSSASKLNKASVTQTGGNLFTGSAGMELSYGQFTVGANMQLPISQRFAEGQTAMRSKGMVHLSFAF